MCVILPFICGKQSAYPARRTQSGRLKNGGRYAILVVQNCVDAMHREGIAMTLYETIFRRKSNRSYQMTPLAQDELARISEFFCGIQPLIPGIRYRMTLTTPDQIESIQTWRAPHYALLYSEDAPLAMENIGYVGQMLDLYLQANGYGSCWLGLAHLKDGENAVPREIDGMKFAITICFGRVDGDHLRSLDGFKRRTLEEIADTADARLEAVRIAPSATNSQPWFFTHDGELLHVYRKRHNVVRQRMLGRFNRMDIGIALAHLQLANPERFEIIIGAPHKEIRVHDYVLSCKI